MTIYLDLPHSNGVTPDHLQGLGTAAPAPAHAMRLVFVNKMHNQAEAEQDVCRFFGSLGRDVLIRFRTLDDGFVSSWKCDRHQAQVRPKPASEADIVWCDGILGTGSAIETTHFTAGIAATHQATERLSALVQKHNKFEIGWCWSAMSALYSRYGIEPRIPQERGKELPLSHPDAKQNARKIYGVYPQQVADEYAHLISDELQLPVSRRARYTAADLARTDFDIITQDAESGPGILIDRERRWIGCLNHPEYLYKTLMGEYVRDGRQRIKDHLLANPQDAEIAHTTYAALYKRTNFDTPAVPREELHDHLKPLAITLAVLGLKHPAPVNYPLDCDRAQQAQQQSYEKNAAALFNSLFEEIGVFAPRPARHAAPRPIQPAAAGL